MDPLKKSENIIEPEDISNYYLDYEGWNKKEWEFLENEEEEKEEIKEELDIFEDFLVEFEDIAEEKIEEEELRKVIDIKKEKDVSEETLITSEEESIVSEELSVESSIHPCLKDIDISDSRLKLQNLYTMFPIPDDPGLVPAFWTIQERRPSYADDGIMKFFDLVKAFYMRPIQAMEDMLRTNKINLQYYGLDSRIIKPLSEALMKNPTVNTINLTGNWLSEDACYHLNELLLKNNIIHTLLLSGCKIGANGVAKLYDGIFTNETLKKLDLSDCNLRKEGIDYLVQAICNNESIETLLLNHNHLDESCSDALQKLVNCSKTIKHLELSWNSLYTTETWKKFIRGFEENETLLDLDLSWNALGKECISYLRRLLLRSLILKKLHLNGNRFTNDDVSVIARALSRNATLEELYIGDNPFKADGAFALVKAITPEKSSESQLRILDLTNIWANKNIIPELETIQNSKPWVDIRLGGIFSNYKIEGPDVKAILLKRANYEAMKPKKKRRRKNFGHFVLSLSDDLISKGKFLELVQNFQLNLSKSLLNELMIAFTGIKNTVDQGLLKSVYMKQYPNTKLPTEKPKKIKSKKRKIKKKEIKETNEEENL